MKKPLTFMVGRKTGWAWCARPMLGVLIAGLVLSASVGAQQNTNFPTRAAFNVIQQNNIFNPNRTYYIPGRERTNRQTTRVPAFALVGTMSYSKGKFAFFDGNNYDYKKVLEPGGKIAGYTVKEVTQTNVIMSANGKDFEMPLGTQMRNEGNKWTLSGHIIEDTQSEESSETNGEAAADASTPPAGGSAEASDVLKRLMQQRQQELK